MCLDAVGTQQDLDVLVSGCCQMLVHHGLVHLLHQLQIQYMEVWLLHHITPFSTGLQGVL